MKQFKDILIHIKNPKDEDDLIEMFDVAVEYIRQAIPKKCSLTRSEHPHPCNEGDRYSYAGITVV